MPPPKATGSTLAFRSIISTRKTIKESHVQDNKQKRRSAAEVQRTQKEEEARRQAEQAEGEEDRKRQNSSNYKADEQELFVPGPEQMAMAAENNDSATEPQEFVNPVSSGSSDDYQPPAEDDGESEISTDNSDNGDEGDQIQVPTDPADVSASRKSQPSKSASLSSSSSFVSQAAIGTKRDASAAQTLTGAQPQAKKHTHANLNGGAKVPNTALISGWGDEVVLQGTSALEEDSMVREGGFIQDGETDDVDGKSLVRMPKDAKVRKPLLTKKAQHGGKNKWTLDHLLTGTKHAFINSLTSLAQVKAGTTDPWSRTVVTQMGGFSIISTIELTSAFVDSYLTKKGTPLPPYLFKLWEENEETSKIKRQGRFQSDLIIYTLAHAHFMEYDSIPDPKELNKGVLPCGAVVLALQAVEHAFKFWTSGQYVQNQTLQFSADLKKNATGKIVDFKVLGSGYYLTTVRALDKDQWRQVFDAVNEIRGWKTEKEGSRKTVYCNLKWSKDLNLEERVPVIQKELSSSQKSTSKKE
ncbi:hypothetical protein CPC08DRAFT_731085 [Agrocybe pediades]|nr:hypothetical protein CPC08DRAFT_731085 [Agrocybe pediades]